MFNITSRFLVICAYFIIGTTVAFAACTIPSGSYSGKGGGTVYFTGGVPAPVIHAVSHIVSFPVFPSTSSGGTFTMFTKFSATPPNSASPSGDTTKPAFGQMPTGTVSAISNWNPTTCQGNITVNGTGFIRSLTCSDPSTCTLGSPGVLQNNFVYLFTSADSGNHIIIVESTLNGYTVNSPIELWRQ